MKTEEKQQQPAVVKKEITTQVLSKVNSFIDNGELRLPKDYSPENALKGAMLILDELKDRNNKKVLEVCSKTSIAQALLKMCVEGLSPIKKQGYFIPYGTELNWSRSYQGSIALARRVGEVDKVNANVIYNDDDFNYEIDVQTGMKRIINHSQKIENIDNTKIKGAYAVTIFNDGTTDLEVMTIDEIRKAWDQGATKGASPAHKNFTQEMCKKTVINRACKGPINSSSDAILMEDESTLSRTEKDVNEVQEEIENDTMSETVDFEEVHEETTKQEEGQSTIDGPGF